MGGFNAGGNPSWVSQIGCSRGCGRFAVDAGTEETKGQVAISLFPNDQLGIDADMMAQLRSGVFELATMPSTVLRRLFQRHR
jgi:Bacterial extracellular solute-binding protein, family 7